MTDSVQLSIICPFYNEQEMISLFFDKILAALNKTGKSFEIVCVNDGSKDNTLLELISGKEKCPSIRIINLSRNFGKEAALTAGLDYAIGQAVIPIDADLQDPPELIFDFIKKWEEGYDVVLGKRVDRSEDGFFKRVTAKFFYKAHNRISNTKIPENVGDYRLMSRKVVDAIKKLPENQRFMKGVFAWAGFKTTTIEYKRLKRHAGNTSFSGWKLWNFALDGITSFSTSPLRIWLYVGVIISTLSFSYGLFTIIKTMILGINLPGYASLLTVVLFLGGIQLISLGILGEYIGRTYLESKRRPNYVVDEEY